MEVFPGSARLAEDQTMNLLSPVRLVTLRPYVKGNFVLGDYDSMVALRLVGLLAFGRRHVSAARLQRHAFYLARLVGLAVVRTSYQVTGSRL